MVCFVFGANPPSMLLMGSLSVFGKTKVDKIGMVNRGVFLVKFQSKEDQEKACGMTGLLFVKKPFIIEP